MTKYKIYIDMDEVLVSLNPSILEFVNNSINQKTPEGIKAINLLKKNIFTLNDLNFDTATKEMKEFVRLFTCNNREMWMNLPWKEDGLQLWNFVINSNNDFYILSSPTDSKCKRGKYIWLLSELKLKSFKNRFEFVLNNVFFEKKKYLYAEPNSILIDDSEYNIKMFQKYGGIGILHKNTKQTIKELKKILNK
jgi:5'(3')-deoxyribonucleotidase